MRITYVLARPELGGGNKVVFQHADLLLRLGHSVSILGEGPAPEWFEVTADYVDASAGPIRLPSQDLVIATFWTTVRTAVELNLGPPVHFCQGYEGSHVHYRELWPEIDAAYQLALPSFTVTPYLGELLSEQFGTASRVVPPPVDPWFRPRPRHGPRRRPWVALPGVFGARVKGLPTAIRAVKRLRDWGHPCRVLRFSTFPLGTEERQVAEPDRYLTAVPPQAIAEALRDCDLLLMPSEPEEGFGLPLLEAMASGVPAVASEIPSTRYMTHGTLPLIPVGDDQAMAAAARNLLSDRRAWRRIRRAGRRAARSFRPAAIAEALADAVQWARDEPWEPKPIQHEPGPREPGPPEPRLPESGPPERKL
ncbi:MAG: glycosyltransferase family 4 protein [Acidobacteriota bacterium]